MLLVSLQLILKNHFSDFIGLYTLRTWQIVLPYVKFNVAALEPVCCQFPQLYIVHYMDDLVIAGPDQDQLLRAYIQMQQDLEKVGLIIVPEKVQI